MSDFSNMLPVRTRAIAPDYQSQWKDRVYNFSTVPEGTDFLVAGFPYSIHNNQFQVIGGVPYPLTAMETIDDQIMLTIDDQVMETI